MGDKEHVGGEDLARLSRSLRMQVDDDHKAHNDWRKQFTLSLAVGNGAGLLAYFNAAGGARAADVRALGRFSGWLFLVGVMLAALAAKLAARERAQLGRLGSISADWADKNYAPEAPELGSVVEVTTSLSLTQWLLKIAESCSAVCFAVGVGLALLSL